MAGTKAPVDVRSGAPLFRTTRAGRIVEWNQAAEELSGISASSAVGSSCWDVMRGRDAGGGVVCHRGCSVARLAREGWPVRCVDLHVGLPSGVNCVTVSTIVVGAGDDALVLHPMHVARAEAQPAGPSAPALTARQREILSLLASGMRAKEIATQLSLSVSTVRNHIHALLRRLGVSSQLAAVAKAQQLGMCDRASGGLPPRR